MAYIVNLSEQPRSVMPLAKLPTVYSRCDLHVVWSFSQLAHCAQLHTAQNKVSQLLQHVNPSKTS
jgi:hypothetical protein